MKLITDREYREYLDLKLKFDAEAKRTIKKDSYIIDIDLDLELKELALLLDKNRLKASNYILKEEVNLLKKDKAILVLENTYLRLDVERLELQIKDYLFSDMRMENAKQNLKKTRDAIIGCKGEDVITESEILVYCKDMKVRNYKIGETYALGIDLFYISAFEMKNGICHMVDRSKHIRICPTSEFFKEFPTKIK